jgi:hypothetical protein
MSEHRSTSKKKVTPTEQLSPLDRRLLIRDKVNPMLGDYKATLVLSALADRMNSSHKCWPSLAQIKTDTNLSESGVKRGLKILTDKKVLSVQLRRRETNIYTFTPEKFLSGQVGLSRKVLVRSDRTSSQVNLNPGSSTYEVERTSRSRTTKRGQSDLTRKTGVQRKHSLRNITKVEQDKRGQSDLTRSQGRTQSPSLVCTKHDNLNDGIKDGCTKCTRLDEQLSQGY